MLIAASVMNSVSGWPGTSMMKTWLIRRSVRRPVAEEVTSRHQLVGVQAALHQQLALALADQRHRLGGGGVAVRGVDDLAAGEVDAVLGGDGADPAPPGRPAPAR